MTEVDPFIAVGSIRFGWTKSQLLREIGPSEDTFVKGGVVVDGYDERGFHVHYSQSGTVEYVEFFEPGGIACRGLELVPGQPMLDVVRHAAATRGELSWLAPDLLVLPELGLSIWESGEVAETIGAFGRADYYDVLH